MNTTSFSPLLRISLLAFAGALLAPPAGYGADEQAANGALVRDSGQPVALTAETSPEDEYAELCRRAREADALMQQKWAAATPAERIALRAERLQQMDGEMTRRNELAQRIAARRRASAKPAGAEAVPAIANAQPEEAIKGKSPKELERLGVDVKKLHGRQAGQP